MGRGGEKAHSTSKESKSKNSKIINSIHNKLHDPIIKINGSIINGNSQSHGNRRDSTRTNGASATNISRDSRMFGCLRNDSVNLFRGNENATSKGESNSLEHRHHKRISSNTYLNPHDFRPVCNSHKIISSLRHFHSFLLTPLKKPLIPFAALASSFLFTTKTSAQSFLERGDVTKGKFANENYENTSIFTQLGDAADAFMEIVNWFKNFPEKIAEISIDMFREAFELITFLMLQTPSVIFSGEYVRNVVPSFSLISVTVVILATIYESIMMMIGKKHTKGTDILKRLPIAIGIAGITPFLFEKGFKLLNKLTIGITKIAGGVFDPNFLKGIANAGVVDALGLLAFDIALIIYTAPLIIQNARRWWDLFVLSCVSPFALTAFVFDRHRHLFDTWINAVKRKATVQLIYATFISLLGVFLFSTRLIAPEMWIIKLILIIGCLSRLGNPPNIVKSYLRGETLDKEFKNVYGNKLKSLNPIHIYKAQKTKNNKKEELRKKHGRRFVDDLM